MNISAHGIGGAQDLPIPLELALSGAVAALVISFTVLALAWRSPRYGPDRGGLAVPRLDRVVSSPGWRVALRLLGLVLFGYAGLAAVLGQDLVINPFFGMLYVWLWVGLVPASLLLGPVWRMLNPIRTVHLLIARAAGTDPGEGLLRYPERLGVWPAALGLLSFVWLELAYPHSTELDPVRLWVAAYVALVLVGGTLFGETFFARADPFEVYSSLVAKLSVWHRRDGRLLIRNPLANLATSTPRPGLVAVVAVLFGSTAYDSFSESPMWLPVVQSDWVAGLGAQAPDIANSLALVGFCLLAGLIFAVGTRATAVRPGIPHRELPARFAHSIVPIIVGYMVAHYLTYLVQTGSQTLILASDPLSTGADWLGTGDWSVNYWLSYQPTLLATIKVLAVILGHVVAVVSAHDRALELLPRRHQLTGQLPLLFAMVIFTVGGLWLLFAS